MDEPPRDDAQVAEDPDGGTKGPLGWLNWLAARAGQPARTDSSTDHALLIPLWQEFGLYSDASFTGELELGPATVKLAFASDVGRTGHAQMVAVLRVVSHLGNPTYDSERWETEDVDVYHGGDDADEFASLLALALGRRLRSGGVTRHMLSGGDPAGSPFHATHHAPQLAAPIAGRPLLPAISAKVNLADASNLMDAYSQLSGEHAVTLVRAATQFADALWWADLDPRISWIKLVGALEIAAKQWSDSEGLTRLQRFKAHMGLVYKGFKDQHGEAVADAVAEQWDENAGATSRFEKFTVAHAPVPPPTRPTAGRVDWTSLGDSLRTIYDWRSRDLYAGIPFPAPMCESPRLLDDEIPPERFPALAASHHGGSWPAQRMPMYLHTFAFITRQALTNWWGALPAAGLPAARAERGEAGQGE